MGKIINNIEEVRVGFPNAKLLQEKGFDCICSFAFNGAYEPHHLNIIELGFKQSNSELLKNVFTAPTQQVAIDWFRINFGIHVDCQVEGINLDIYRFICFKTSDERVKETIKHIEDDSHNGRYDTPEEAKEVAINYVLINLI